MHDANTAGREARFSLDRSGYFMALFIEVWARSKWIDVEFLALWVFLRTFLAFEGVDLVK